ncbi:MAG: helix-turn-helix transcriptional regulator, partial [Chloroflexota bacterium]
MGLGSYILYLRALKGGITPRELAAELGMPEHYIHAIELEKHAGNIDSRSKLAAYFNIPIEDFNEYARSTHLRFMEILKKERRPQMGFLLMSGETLMGTVDGADTSIIKIVELNTGAKTILQRHAIKKWWPLKSRSERFEDSGSSEYRSGGGPGSLARRPSGPDGPGGGRPPRPSGPAGPPRPNRPSVFSDRDRPD